MKKTVVFDFDGVIHSYSSGWQGVDVIPDPPVPGIKEAIDSIRAAGYEVVVVSTRCASLQGHGAVRAWLFDNEIEVDDVMMRKPPAIVYIDDRAICFDGKPEKLLDKIKAFEPWYAKQTFSHADRIRAMSDEELMETLYPLTDIEKIAPFCKGLQECVGMLANDEDIPDEKCKACLLKWLQQPAEVEKVRG